MARRVSKSGGVTSASRPHSNRVRSRSSSSVISELKKSNEYIPTPDNILDYISKYYGIEKEIICGQQRVKDAVAARQIAMYLIRGMTNLPVVEIGKVFDNRDHSTVLYSLKQVEKQMKKDPAFAETVKEIKTNINNRH